MINGAWTIRYGHAVTASDPDTRSVLGPQDVRTAQEFADALTRAREAAGLSVRQAAVAAGLPPGTAGDYFSGRHLPPVTRSVVLTSLLAACQITNPDEVAAWLEALRRVRRTTGQIRRTRNPYRGLTPFQADDANDFFGRDDLCASILAALQRAVDQPGPAFVVLGPSGVGKSSLLRAGLLPAACTSADPPVRMLFTPGAEPMRAWAQAYAHAIGANPDQVGTLLGTSGGQDQLLAEHGRALIVVDQLEELLSSADAHDVNQFLNALTLTASRSGTGARHVVVLGLRADFYAQALTVPALADALRERQFIVPPMGLDQLRQVIVEPARRHQVTVEPALVELLLRDVSERHGAPGPATLPRLSHALQATWSRGNGSVMTVADYQASGGVNQAVRASADAILVGLPEQERTATRLLFLRLVRVDETGAVTRHHVRWEELPTELTGQVGHVLDEFAAARLLTVDEDGIEIGHEALIREWPQLAQWVAEDQHGVRVAHDLRDRARQWQRDRDPGFLLRGGPLAVARDWATPTNRATLNATELAYLDESIAATDNALEHDRRSARRLRRLVAAVAALAMLASVAAAAAVRETMNLSRERDVALSRQVAVEATQLRANDPALAAQLALAAYRISPTLEARSALLDVSAEPAVTRLIGPEGLVQVAVAASRQVMVAAGVDGRLRLYRTGATVVATGAVKVADPGAAYAVALNPQGDTAAVGGAGDTVALVDITNPANPKVTAQLKVSGGVYNLAFSADGKHLAAGAITGDVHRWAIGATHAPRAEPALSTAGSPVHAVAYSPDGSLIAAAADGGTLRLFSTATGRQAGVLQLGQSSNVLLSLAFAPDGKRLAVGGKDKAVRVVDVTRPAAARAAGKPLTGSGSWVNAVAYNQDGTALAGGSSDNTVRVWDPTTGAVLSSLPGPSPVTSLAWVQGAPHRIAAGYADGLVRVGEVPGPVLPDAADSVFVTAFTRDGRTLLTAAGSADGAARLWDVANPNAPRLRSTPLSGPGPDASDGAGAITPDGSLVALGSHNGHVTLWDPARPAAPLATLTTPTALIENVLFSSDGHLLAAGDDAHQVHLWDVRDPARPRPLATLTAASNLILGLAISRDAHLLAAASADNTVVLWDITNPRQPTRKATLTAFANYAMSVAFTPEGRTLAAGSADKTVQLWDVSDPGHPKKLGSKLTGPTNYVFALAFNPDGTSLAAASAGGGVWLWDTTNPSAPAHTATLGAIPGPLLAVAYSPDGSHLAAGGQSHSVRLWRTDPRDVANYLCAPRGTAITAAEWGQYIGTAYQDPCTTRQ